MLRYITNRHCLDQWKKAGKCLIFLQLYPIKGHIDHGKSDNKDKHPTLARSRNLIPGYINVQAGFNAKISPLRQIFTGRNGYGHALRREWLTLQQKQTNFVGSLYFFSF